MKFLRRASLLRLCVAIGMMMVGIAGCQPKITPTAVYYTVTLQVAGAEGGTLTAKTDGKTLTNNEKVKVGTKVRFTANPKSIEGYIVGAWTGIDAAPGTGVVELIITQDVTVSVAFVKNPPPPVQECTVKFSIAEHAEGGTLTATVNGKTLTNNEKVKAGTKVRFIANPKSADGYTIGAWTGTDAAAGTGAVELIITQDVNVTVAFVKRQCTITFGASEGGSISAKVEGDTDNLQSDGKAPYGSIVTFTAIPEDGYVFDRWEGLTNAPSEETATYTVTGDRYVKAYFKSVFWKYLTVNEDSGMIRLLETDHAKQHLKGKFFIPTHVHNIRVIGIGETGFKDCNEITEVVLPESIKYIDKMAFHECKKLTSITLSQSLEAIKEGAFGFCEKLKTIDIPNGIKRIEKSTFYTCQELENVHLPEGLEEIEESAFEACKKLDIYLPSTIKTIGKRAFGLGKYNTAIKTVYIPKSQNDRIRKLINSSKLSISDQLPAIKEYDDTQPIP